ncbi:chromate transporter [Desertibacillus haloalkaliphilus]|uniref:chromate transporter n=1 Tax=Desertibacillus haloalkaliphilus TaxID=1328930 RepID=UPI001C27CEB0|nr:chromate transporter [Desertibacillus haloalkaliphilus]MBU8908866.1 chromate transporter [Desertibacillus haloalkaliphilus]
MEQGKLFLAFFRVGLLGYGGGPASIPLVHKEVVEKYKWMDAEEFTDILAIGNTLPGPIATKMAGYIGYRVAGVLGMINAIIATVVPTIGLLILLLTSLASFSDQAWVQGMTKAVVPVVGVMMAVLTWDFFEKAKAGLGWLKSGVLFLLSFVSIGLIDVHPGIIIVTLLLIALYGPVRGMEGGER